MTSTRGLLAGLALLIAVSSVWLATTDVIPSVAAGALLHPSRRPMIVAPPAGCADVTYAGAGVTLRGWDCRPAGQRRATLVFLHGIGDNRSSVSGAIGRFIARGIEVIAYDSRAHGQSTGDACTYGYWEKRDLRSVIDAAAAERVVLVGTSLGAAVALQEAADDPRVIGIVAAEVFSDLRTVARERAPRFLTDGMIRRAFSIAEASAAFRVDEASPVEAARRITAPVLLIHGSRDTETTPDHSQRVLAALRAQKELLLVDGAAHNESLQPAATWERIDRWIDNLLNRAP
jgi:pimeloyl-ACP methyl ester carboxylesterase